MKYLSMKIEEVQRDRLKTLKKDGLLRYLKKGNLQQVTLLIDGHEIKHSWKPIPGRSRSMYNMMNN
ncbi:MAG: hypothetical protein DI539_12205 [Flavobacterium psychrophilum]|nr:MAG: hypothetical protein DI539_12205 [Flavobacterium psychrophilum]